LAANNWRAVSNDGTDYFLRTSTTTGTTASEVLRSAFYDLSAYQSIQVSFETSFLNYATGRGVIAYLVNDLGYTTIDIINSPYIGTKVYQLPIIEGAVSVRFRFTYNNTTVNTGEANHWEIDNFIIIGLVRDDTPPTPIASLSLLELGTDWATVSWQPSSDLYFDRYEIYISADEDISLSDRLWTTNQDASMSNVFTTNTTITDLAEQHHWLAIRAIDQSGNATPLSAPLHLIFDNTPPSITNPIPTNQPLPVVSNSRTVLIGATIVDANPLQSIMYRIDANANGTYDASESWQEIPQSRSTRNTRETIVIQFPVTLPSDGTFAFEFKAIDQAGNTSYSGIANAEGIEDDWIVRIDTTPPPQPIP
ncbi:MAG: hypothetical protein U1C33_01130, partial [Candidatus Cloacimonadaceae bacterium]|nr:hypothetical protein [Candidatus Cloacimonadaceae bacterium]